MSALHVTQIRAGLKRIFDGKIDLSDIPRKQDVTRRDDAFATRSLAAYGVAIAAGVTPESVAPYVVDSYGDNGIDVIYFDPDDKRLYLAQAKFIKAGLSGISLGDSLKFLSGVRDLMNNDFASFSGNPKVLALRQMIQQALEDATTRVTLVLAHTSIESLSKEVTHRIQELLDEVNDASEIISFEQFGQTDLHNALSGLADGSPLYIEAMISDWGYVKEPYQAYYGQINAAELAGWYTKYGDRLLTKNIRKALGQTEINRQIASTASDTPEHFWYFNNGVTVLCQSVEKKPLGGGGKSSAVLECRGVSIVNGAQTVASLSAAATSSMDSVKRASVLIRFISLEKCPVDFATAVTRATNVQNRIEHRDFASLDPTQERLRRELLLEGKTYAYKAGDSPFSADSACTMEEAALALACSNPDVSLAVIAKAKIGSVWDNVGAAKSVYKRLFHDTTTGITLWRLVELLRTIDDILRAQQKDRSGGKARMIAVHGNRFIAHLAFRQLDTDSTREVVCDMDQLKEQIAKSVPVLLSQVAKLIQDKYPGAYLQSLFKNSTKCSVLSNSVKRLHASNTNNVRPFTSRVD